MSQLCHASPSLVSDDRAKFQRLLMHAWTGSAYAFTRLYWRGVRSTTVKSDTYGVAREIDHEFIF